MLLVHPNIAAFVIASPVVVFLGAPEGGYFLVGYLSHLMLDMMTKSGVPLLGPFTKKRFHLLPPFLRVKTGGAIDHIIQFGTGIIYVLLLAYFSGGIAWLNLG